MDLTYLEGKKFCVIFVKTDDEDAGSDSVRIKCMHGRANIDRRGKLTVESPQGSFTVPTSALPTVQESDGTEMLKDAEYFVMCKVSGMEL